jgi:hypothetical protein
MGELEPTVLLTRKPRSRTAVGVPRWLTWRNVFELQINSRETLVTLAV